MNTKHKNCSTYIIRFLYWSTWLQKIETFILCVTKCYGVANMCAIVVYKKGHNNLLEGLWQKWTIGC